MKLSRRARRILRSARLPFEWLGIWIAIAVFAVLPRRAMLALCDVLSAAMYRLDRRGKRNALANLRIVTGIYPVDTPYKPCAMDYLPTRAEDIVIRRSYRNMVRSVGHAFWTCRNACARVAEAGELCEEGRRLLASNRPAVTVSGHIGCWEILSQLAFLEGHRMMSVAKSVGTSGMTDLLIKARTSIGQEIVRSDGAFRALMEGVRSGRSLGLLVDQVVHPRDGGVWVRFFGRPHPVSAAPAFFAVKAKSPIIVAWSRPLRDGRYRCEVVDVIPCGEARDMWATTQRCLHDLERVIRRHPSCWVLNYNCFRKRPSSDDLATLNERERKAGVS